MGTFFPQICCFQYSGARRICKYILTIYFSFYRKCIDKSRFISYAVATTTARRRHWYV